MPNRSETIIYLGADHGGYELKEMIKEHLLDQGWRVTDLGAEKLAPKDDYPDMAQDVALQVAAQDKALGILFCRSGGGMAIAANKINNIRAVELRDVQSAKLAKEKNNANIISLGADVMTLSQAQEIISAFLDSKFSGEKRHQRRINKIKKIEQQE